MERDTFDRLTRLIGTAGTRRDALRLVATATLLGGVATRQDAAAKGRKKRGKVRAQQEQEVPEVCLISGGLGCSHGPEPERCFESARRGANLSNCNYITESGVVDLPDLRGANLSGACFFATEAIIGLPRFRAANLSNACFLNADLALGDFRSTNVSGATFCGADLRGADFRGSNITAEQLACATVGCDTILPNGKPAIPCTGGQICCGAVCCNPENCEQNTCVEPPVP